MAKKKSKAKKKAAGKKGKKSAPKKMKKKMARPAKKKAVRKPAPPKRAPRKRAPRPEWVMKPSAGPAVVAAETITIVVDSPSDLGQLNEPTGPDLTSAT
jgi:hypothetical protein